MSFAEQFNLANHDTRDPDPWLALYMDNSILMDDEAKAALLLCMRSTSRQFLLPFARPCARLTMILLQLVKTVMPNQFTSSRVLHRLIYWGLKNWVSPEANFLILRHFHIGSEILAFIESNTQSVDISLNPLKPRTLADLLDDVFLQHDLNLFNFVIEFNKDLREAGVEVQPPAKLNFDCITEGQFEFAAFPKKWRNFIDIQTAIELYTPMYQLFLTDNDFWRASNSLQLDETVALYVARILGHPEYLALVNNKHPMVPLTTLSAGFRLMLHGLAAESLHAMLREAKRQHQKVAAIGAV
ncbi:MAG: hypothetical protein HY231_12845 [Acidobacteria bacterium]|nr:hypothetical protein [Acidobacteriota bacterium]